MAGLGGLGAASTQLGAGTRTVDVVAFQWRSGQVWPLAMVVDRACSGSMHAPPAIAGGPQAPEPDQEAPTKGVMADKMIVAGWPDRSHAHVQSGFPPPRG